MIKRCPHCGGLDCQRLGVRFTPKEAEIVDGLLSRGALERYVQIKDVVGEYEAHTARKHIYNIKSKLEECDWRIKGKHGSAGGYMIMWMP